MSANEMNDLECWRALRGEPNGEGRREEVEDAGRLAEGGEPGSTPATQAEIVVMVLRWEMVRPVGVCGHGAEVGAREGGGWARKLNESGLARVVIRGPIIANLRGIRWSWIEY